MSDHQEKKMEKDISKMVSVSERIGNWTQLEHLEEKSLEAALKETDAIIRDNFHGAWEAFKMQLKDCSTSEKPKFKIGVDVVLSPMGSNYIHVCAKISYGTKHNDESVGYTVSNQPELAIDA